MWSVSTASFLIIGNELLTGKVEEQNLRPLAQTLRKRGVRLVESRVVPDETAAIVKAAQELSAATDVVFSSGGVGPTHDDITMDAMAEAFDTTVHVHPRLLSLLKTVYGEDLSDGQRRLARMPVAAHFVDAPGTEAEWPGVVMKNVWILPGIPELFRSKLRLVRQHITAPGEPWVSAEVGCVTDESELKPHIDATVRAFPDVDVGSYPRWFGSKIRTLITFDGRRPDRVEAAAADFRQRLDQQELEYIRKD